MQGAAYSREAGGDQDARAAGARAARAAVTRCSDHRWQRAKAPIRSDQNPETNHVLDDTHSTFSSIESRYKYYGSLLQASRLERAGCDPAAAAMAANHAKNKCSGRIIPLSVLGFWDKNTGICAGAIPYRWDFPATTQAGRYSSTGWHRRRW